MKAIPLFQAKSSLTRIVHAVEQGEAVELTRHGRPVAVLLGIEAYRALQEGRPGFAAALAGFRREWGEVPEGEDFGSVESLRVADGGREPPW